MIFLYDLQVRELLELQIFWVAEGSRRIVILLDGRSTHFTICHERKRKNLFQIHFGYQSVLNPRFITFTRCKFEISSLIYEMNTISNFDSREMKILKIETGETWLTTTKKFAKTELRQRRKMKSSKS